MPKLADEEVSRRLSGLKGWKREGDYITKALRFKGFVEAVEFVKRLVPIAEGLGHHPDVIIQNYNEVIVRLTTHDEGGITELDFELAKEIDKITL